MFPFVGAVLSNVSPSGEHALPQQSDSRRYSQAAPTPSFNEDLSLSDNPSAHIASRFEEYQDESYLFPTLRARQENPLFRESSPVLMSPLSIRRTPSPPTSASRMLLRGGDDELRSRRNSTAGLLPLRTTRHDSPEIPALGLLSLDASNRAGLGASRQRFAGPPRSRGNSPLPTPLLSRPGSPSLLRHDRQAGIAARRSTVAGNLNLDLPPLARLGCTSPLLSSHVRRSAASSKSALPPLPALSLDAKHGKAVSEAGITV